MSTRMITVTCDCGWEQTVYHGDCPLPVESERTQHAPLMVGRDDLLAVTMDQLQAVKRELMRHLDMVTERLEAAYQREGE